LYQVARFGLVGNLNLELESLQRLKLIWLDPKPTLVNRSFAEFVLAVYPEEEERLTAAERGRLSTNAWTAAKMPTLLALGLVLAYVFFTQPTAWNNAYAWLTALAAGLAAIAKVTDFFGARKSGSAGAES
jgi:hypothetical protein